MLVELLRHGNVDLTRRWVGTLLMVPEAERLAVVEAVEKQVVSLYASNPEDDVVVAPDAATETESPRRKAKRLKPDTTSAEPPQRLVPASEIESKPIPPQKRRRNK